MPRAKPLSKSPSRLEGARARMYHDLIFESAEHVFGEHGFETATMQDVAKEAGVSLKTVYASFDGKLELYQEIHEVRSRAFIAAVGEALIGAEGPLEQIARLARAYAEFLLEHAAWLRITLSERVSWGLGPRTGTGSESWLASIRRMTEIVQEGMDRGLFHEGDAETLAATCLAVMQVQIARAVGKGERDAGKVAAEIETQLQRLLGVSR